MKRGLAVKALMLGLMALALLATKCPQPEVIPGPWYVNYHAHVYFKKGANDFHVIIANIDSAQVKRLWFSSVPGKPAPSPFPTLTSSKVVPFGPNAIMASWEFEPTVDSCKWLHFGVHGDRKVGLDNPKHLFAFWTRRDLPSHIAKPVAIVPLPTPVWKINGDTVLCLIKNTFTLLKDLPGNLLPAGLDSVRDIRSNIVIGQEMAFSEKVFSLADLMWENKEVSSLKWDKPGNPVTLQKDASTEKRIIGLEPAKHKAVISKYWVYSPEINDTILFVITQTEIIEKKP